MLPRRELSPISVEMGALESKIEPLVCRANSLVVDGLALAVPHFAAKDPQKPDTVIRSTPEQRKQATDTMRVIAQRKILRGDKNEK